MDNKNFKSEFIVVTANNDDIDIIEKVNKEVKKYIDLYKIKGYYVSNVILVSNTKVEIKYLILFQRYESRITIPYSYGDTFESYGGGGGKYLP